MCSSPASTALHWRRVKFPQGDLRMNLPMLCLLLFFIFSQTQQVVVDKSGPSRWLSYQMDKAQHMVRNLKRHSDGTFTSDFTHYLDRIKAKDFVEWLANPKREGCCEVLLDIAVEV